MKSMVLAIVLAVLFGLSLGAHAQNGEDSGGLWQMNVDPKSKSSRDKLRAKIEGRKAGKGRPSQAHVGISQGDGRSIESKKPGGANLKGTGTRKTEGGKNDSTQRERQTTPVKPTGDNPLEPSAGAPLPI